MPNQEHDSGLRERGQAGEARDAVDYPGLLIHERVLPALASSAGRIRRELLETLAGHDVAADRRADIALVVTEAATNAVVHGYRDSAPGPLYAAATLAGGSLTIWISDFGCGMRPHPAGSGLGLGMPLIAHLCDQLEVSSEADVQGTRVTATFAGIARRRSSQTDRTGTSTRPSGRREMLLDYLHSLRAESAGLREDTDAVLAQADLAVARARRLMQQQRTEHP